MVRCKSFRKMRGSSTPSTSTWTSSCPTFVSTNPRTASFTSSKFCGKLSEVQRHVNLHIKPRVVYKARRSWGDGIAVRGYSEYRAHQSGFSKHVSKCRQVLKIATKDYLAIHSLAHAIARLLRRSKQVRKYQARKD